MSFPRTMRSDTGTSGRLSESDCQLSPSSYETYTPCWVAAYNIPRLVGSSRTAWTQSSARMPFTTRVHVRPKSCVRKMYGALSSSRGRRTETYAAPASNADASIWLTRPNAGIPLGVTLRHVAPPSRVSCTSPSSLPVQMTLTSRLDGAMEKITA